MSSISNYLLTLHGTAALALIFLLPAAESSIFVGFIFPGETVVILGGVLASEHRISLIAAMALASLGAIVGDSIGYFVGKKWGRSLIDGGLSRFIKPAHIKRAEDFVVKRGGPGVFIGRFTAALRVLVPGISGVSGMHYRTFAIFNVTGGIAWAISMTMLGYGAGQSFKQVEKVAGQISYIVLAVVLVAIAVFVVLRKRRERAINATYATENKIADPPESAKSTDG